jgi:RNA polymerase sigma-70 factor (ECF subfamily)
MPTDNAFLDFLRRIRAGDEGAAAELVRRYEPVIRREVRLRLNDPALYRVFDSGDICQSVLLSFFVRAAAGQYDFDQPADLLNLLLYMARNKVATQARKLRRRAAGGPHELDAVIDPQPGPGRVIDSQDLLRQVLHRLGDDERRLAELRGQGRSWPEVAAQLGGTPDARRKQLARALDRVAGQLGLDEEP